MRNLFSVDFLLSIPAVLWAISFHEFCHGYAAKLVGDPTAERHGRLTLSPFAHFDLMGTLLLLFFGFGWAKPVPINTRYFRHPQRDIIIVSLAGIAGNILTAAVSVLLLRLLVANAANPGRTVQMTGTVLTLFKLLLQMCYINIGLAAFNLIPIPPLDGSKVLSAFVPFRFLRHYYWLEQYGMYILIALVATNIIDVIFHPIFGVLERIIFSLA